MRRSFNPSGRHGFSFTEIMIAVLIIGVTLAPMIYVFSRGTSGTIRTRDEVLAYNYATELLDYAQSLKFDEKPFLEEGNRKADEIEINGPEGPVAVLKIEPKFERYLTVMVPPVPDGLPFDYKVLVAEIRWKGQDKKIRMSSIKSRPKPGPK